LPLIYLQNEILLKQGGEGNREEGVTGRRR
jgi:hypothetical protein